MEQTSDAHGNGSSPLARGALDPRHELMTGFRIIPARAGSTSRINASTCSSRDHPRSRGEHARQPHRHAGHTGSSPLARGALNVASTPLGVSWIIPARAGSTS